MYKVLLFIWIVLVSCSDNFDKQVNNYDPNLIGTKSVEEKKTVMQLVEESLNDEKNIQKAISLLKSLDESGDYSGKYNLAKLYIREGYSKPKELKRLLVECLNSDKRRKYAAHLLGYLFYEGVSGFQIDYSESFKYFKISKGNGNELKLDRLWNPFILNTKTGNYYLGMLYYKGLGVDKSKSMAFNYFDKSIGIVSNPFAHFSGNEKIEISSQPEAEFMLGKMYLLGEGTNRNVKNAIYHIKRSYNSEYLEAIKFWDEYKLWKY